ncbi:amino acid transporter heavy chain SLC3A2-like [Watersipora subatra]|uniref:amino acid transporter heavy chain SLC3A2-like n=1 Tax=Watersipora subatra TaxID=2589382 RepID=UPI00355AF741
MSSGENDIHLTKLNSVDPEAANQESAFSNPIDTDAFLPEKAKTAPNGVEATESKASEEQFNCLTREELMRFEKDPAWVKIRWVLFIILLVGWAAMLIAAVVIVVVEPKCPPIADLTWYQDGVAYQVEVDKFLDSNGDGMGDIKGLESKLDHFKDLSVKSVWIDALNVNDQSQLRPSVGTLEDFQQFTKTFKAGGIRVVLGVELNAASVDTIEDIVKSWTEAGAGGFLMSSSDQSGETFADAAASLQAILDEQFNKKDDRARVIIGGESAPLNHSDSLAALVSMPSYNCGSESALECRKNKLASLVTSNDVAHAIALKTSDDKSPWKIPRAGLTPAHLNIAVQLTIPGTPNILYGDEIGFTGSSRGYMLWDDTKTGGFTSNDTWSYPPLSNNQHSVLAQKAMGYDGTSFYSLFKDLATVRAAEPSLKWGDFVSLDFGGEVYAFVRNATDQAPVVVAVNTGDPMAGSLVFGEYSMGKILVTSGVDLDMEDSVDLSAIYLPSKSVVVASMSVPDAK